MLIVMDKDATDAQIQAVVAKIESLGFEAQPMPGGERVAIAILRNPGPVDPALFVDMPGVIQAIPVSRPYKLVSREMNREDTVIHLPGLNLGRGRHWHVAGLRRAGRFAGRLWAVCGFPDNGERRADEDDHEGDDCGDGEDALPHEDFSRGLFGVGVALGLACICRQFRFAVFERLFFRVVFGAHRESSFPLRGKCLAAFLIGSGLWFVR